MRTLLSLMMIASGTLISPNTGSTGRVELKFSTTEIGCMTEALRRLGDDKSIEFKPYPDAPNGQGVIMSISSQQFKSLVSDLTLQSTNCFEQATGMRTEDLGQTP